MLGTLIGILLAVHYARLPDWYILSGMAYYLFACGNGGEKNAGCPSTRCRRAVSTTCRGRPVVFIALALLPVTVLPKSE